MKTIVISAVNLRKGGTLAILKQCLSYLSELASQGEYRVVALVHDKKLCCYENIEYIEFPLSAQSWWRRLKCEYMDMMKVSRQLSPVYLWLSLHDTTPNVIAEHRAVYCHNPFPFFPWKWRHIFFNKKIVAFSLFSKYLYRTNIHKNDYVIVQQDWLRRAFSKMFGLSKEKIVVSLPTANIEPIVCQPKKDAKFHFMFASYPDIHKNFEVICEATRLLEEAMGTSSFDVTLTMGREDNAYARWLNKKWGNTSSLLFSGFLKKEELFELYQKSDCLVFPSYVETWGLPITEFSATGKPMLLADLPYAHETGAGCPWVAFFDPYDAKDLMLKMKRAIEKDTALFHPVPVVELRSPVTHTWEELFRLLLKEGQN